MPTEGQVLNRDSERSRPPVPADRDRTATLARFAAYSSPAFTARLLEHFRRAKEKAVRELGE